MTATDHDRWADSAGAYVLDAMPAGERRQFEHHLEICPRCREEVEELRPAAEALPMASPPMRPPPELKARIMAEVEREAAPLGSTEARLRRRFRLPPVTGWRLAPVAAALLIIGALAGAALRGEGTRSVPAGPNARVEVEGEQAMLVARDMPAPPRGRVYEVWVVPKGQSTPKPTDVLFVPRANGAAVAAIPGSASDVAQVLVSDEPAGGSQTPTGQVVLKANLS